MLKIFTVFYLISILILIFRFKSRNLIYSSNKFYNKRNFGTPTPSYYIVRSLIQPRRPRYCFPQISCIICCCPCRAHPCICGEGRFGEFGNWPRHLGEGSGSRISSQRRLSDREQSAHVFCPRRSCCVSTACRIPYPATLSTPWGGDAGE